MTATYEFYTAEFEKRVSWWSRRVSWSERFVAIVLHTQDVIEAHQPLKPRRPNLSQIQCKSPRSVQKLSNT
jgi:hypothetical protein